MHIVWDVANMPSSGWSSVSWSVRSLLRRIHPEQQNYHHSSSLHCWQDCYRVWSSCWWAWPDCWWWPGEACYLSHCGTSRIHQACPYWLIIIQYFIFILFKCFFLWPWFCYPNPLQSTTVQKGGVSGLPARPTRILLRRASVHGVRLGNSEVRGVPARWADGGERDHHHQHWVSHSLWRKYYRQHDLCKGGWEGFLPGRFWR